MTRRFFDGDGSEDNPYKIASADDLKHFAEEINGDNDFDENFFVLTADIELDEEWTPIGYFIDWNAYKSFRGTFDGGGHTISNLTVNNPSGDHQALFSYLDKDGTIKNLNLTNVVIRGNDWVGVLVGLGNKDTATNCTVTKIG